MTIGFNKDVAWSHTVSTGKRFTLHELTLAPGDPTAYLIDGKPEKMTSRTVSGRCAAPTAASRPSPPRCGPPAGARWW